MPRRGLVRGLEALLLIMDKSRRLRSSPASWWKTLRAPALQSQLPAESRGAMQKYPSGSHKGTCERGVAPQLLLGARIDTSGPIKEAECESLGPRRWSSVSGKTIRPRLFPPTEEGSRHSYPADADKGRNVLSTRAKDMCPRQRKKRDITSHGKVTESKRTRTG